MPRYFEQFFNEEPMREISEEKARASAWYVEEVEGPPLHYRQHGEGKLARIIYPGHEDPAPAVADHRARYDGVPLQVHSPVTTGDRTRWRTWDFDGRGQLQRSIAYELDPDSPAYSESLYSPEGALLFRREHVHDDDGLVEVVTYDQHGKVLNREEVD
ncbi:MAG TPA: hypothetical protein VK698_01115 [Kofleriaceae bacterium]|nr:hypothetical protein [Kofleriaceae bacterium]